ncbi:MAG TPA: Gfo/Idh/MocA family oxidoreductase, partial [Thermoanaerobaculia bacterium]|nr:Gfo/Idh/MocA family oxidoreductase [Thermoanaerobaculia bacterium]
LGAVRRFDLRQGVVLEWPLSSDYLFRKDLAGGGVLMDFGSHLLDLVLWWFGDPATIAYYDDAQGGTESDCRLELSFSSGLEGRVEISRIRDLPNTCRIEGERGTLEVGIWDPDPPVTLSLNGSDVELKGGAVAPGENGGGGFREAFRRQIDDFAQAVREGGTPRVSGAEARRSLQLIETCYATRGDLEFPWMSWLPSEAP